MVQLFVPPPQSLHQQFSLTKFHSPDVIIGSTDTLHFRSLSRKTDALKPLNLTYSLCLLSVDGISLPSIVSDKVLSASTFTLQVYCTWFDLNESCFFGSTYKSPVLASTGKSTEVDQEDDLSLQIVDGEKLKANLDQFELLFHSPTASPNVALIVEYVLNIDNSEFKTAASIGWSPIFIWNPSFVSGLNIPQYLSERNPQIKNQLSERLAVSVPIYTGSPRVLTLLSKYSDFSLLSPYLDLKTGSKVVIDVLIEPSLYPLALYLPEYQLVSTEDSLSGVQLMPDIKIQPTFAVHFSSIQLTFTRQIDLFEEALLDIAAQVFKKHGVDQRFFVLERRLTLQLFNGRTLITSPNTISLQTNDKNPFVLKFPGSVSFDKFSPNSDISLFVVLEYAVLIDEKKYAETKGWLARRFSSGKLKELAKSGIEKHIVLGYASWKPGSSLTAEGEQQKLIFQFDHGLNPANLICMSPKFVINQIQDVDTDMLKDSSPIALTFVTSSSPLVQSTETETMDSSMARHGRSKTESPVKTSAEKLPPPSPKKAPTPIQRSLNTIDDVNESTHSLSNKDEIIEVDLKDKSAHLKLRHSEAEVDTTLQLTRAQRARLMTAGYDTATRYDGSIMPCNVQAPISNGDSKLFLDDARKLVKQETPVLNYELTMMGLTLTDPAVRVPTSVYFTFQFYTFPFITTGIASLCTSEWRTNSETVNLEEDGSPAPTGEKVWPGILHKRNTHSPGVYSVFRSTVLPTPGMCDWILEKGEIHVEVWDADSHFILGFANVPISKPMGEYSIAYDVKLRGIIGAHEMSSDIGLLHYRYSSSFTASELKQPAIAFKSNLGSLPYLDDTMMHIDGHAHKSSDCVLYDYRKNMVDHEILVDALPMVEADPDLSIYINTHRMESVVINEVDERLQDKLAKIRKYKESKNGLSNDLQLNQKSKQRRLQTAQLFRERKKMGIIRNVVADHISTSHKIYAELGQSYFFEFNLSNPFDDDISVEIRYQDQNVRIVTDVDEWKSLKSLNGIREGIVESDFISINVENSVKQVWLKGLETLAIPFVYQESSFTRDKPQLVQISFLDSFSKKPLALLEVTVEPTKYILVDKVLRFFSPENEVLRETIVYDPRDMQRSGQVYIRSSHENIVCEAEDHPQVNSNVRSIKIKYRPGHASTKPESFYLFFYKDRFLNQLVSTWNVFVHSLNRMDISGTLGDVIRASLISRIQGRGLIVDCWSASMDELQFEGNLRAELFGNALNEIKMKVRPLQVGERVVQVNLVDAEDKSLVQNWAIKLNIKSPAVTKEFKVSRPVGKAIQKRISFRNTYTKKQRYVVRSTDPQKVSVVDPVIEANPGKSTYIRLIFHPASTIVKKQTPNDVYITLIDSEGVLEECLRFLLE